MKRPAFTAPAIVAAIVAALVVVVATLGGSASVGARAPSRTVTATVTAVRTVTATATVTLPGPTTTVTAPGPTTTVTATETVAGPTSTVTVTEQSTTATPTPTVTPTPTAAPKIIGMSAPDASWSQRLAEVGRCGIEARRIYGSNTNSKLATIQQAIADGMMPVVSYKVPLTAGDRSLNPWASNLANQLDALGATIALTIFHEPNGDMTGATYVAIHNQLDPIFAAKPNLRVGPIYNGFPLDTEADRADLMANWTTPALMNLWDYYGIDTYNAASDDRVPLLEQITADLGHPDMPLMIGEYNATSAADLAAAGDAFLASPDMWAVLLWNSGDGTGGAQATPVTGDRLAAFQATKADTRVLHDEGC